jgi:hypothetical protein
MFLFYSKNKITPKQAKNKTINKQIVTLNLRSSGRCFRDS